MIRGRSNADDVFDTLLDDLAEGLDLGITAMGQKIAEHAGDDHPLLSLEAQRGRAPAPPRPANPDGTRRFYTRTGNLVGSIQPIDTVRVGDLDFEGGAEAGDVEGALHTAEYGTYIEPAYPFMGPAADAVADEADKIFANTIDKTMSKWK